MKSFYEIEVTQQDGSEISLNAFKDKVLLVVNTATRCGFTKQYEGLETLYQELNDKGFEVLDFPSNQFMNQAPEDDEAINEFCSLNYQTSFKRFKKVDVNGAHADPLFVFLRDKMPKDQGDDSKSFLQKILKLKPQKEKNEIHWNFTKFLVDRSGNVVARYAPTTTPESIRDDILKLLL